MKVDVEKLVQHWVAGSENDFKAAKVLFEKGLYPQCLFFCHLSVEKVMKALVVQNTKEVAPFIHDLIRLAQIGTMELPDEKKDILNDISLFNIAGRYEEDKLQFHKDYNNKDFAKKYVKITEDILLWLKKEFLQK